HGGGCGCKIAPGVLETILHSHFTLPQEGRLLVGNHSRDDAAVYDLGNGTAVISTTDFFMPIVNDPFDFGRIAGANAISDVYAMGGTPLMAIAILGWPVDKLPPEVARAVIDGGKAVCREAGIPLAGGHSIDAPEPIFGLAVTGLVSLEKLKRNNTAQAGDYLYLTKKLGVGVLSTAQKRGLLTRAHAEQLLAQVTKLNRLGECLGSVAGVTALTDVTGFGLLGHMGEMARGSGLSAELYFGEVPLLDGTYDYLAQKVVPGATRRNWDSVKEKVVLGAGRNEADVVPVLCDPQTNGGLLVAVREESRAEVEALLAAEGYGDFCRPVGRLLPDAGWWIRVL
ncbi:MAG TPA: selenide, water dikinase SelD, partial [Chitinophagaceae bacterium]|nr:selenide, water dikinase SelD [Chitinophagaceae bacterium]